MKATASLLEELHRLVAENLIGRLKKDAEDEMFTDAATIGAITKFLKDNNITADPADKSDLENLRDKLKQQSQARRLGKVIQMADRDAKEA
jgi:hypothetical protein